MSYRFISSGSHSRKLANGKPCHMATIMICLPYGKERGLYANDGRGPTPTLEIAWLEPHLAQTTQERVPLRSEVGYRRILCQRKSKLARRTTGGRTEENQEILWKKVNREKLASLPVVDTGYILQVSQAGRMYPVHAYYLSLLYTALHAVANRCTLLYSKRYGSVHPKGGAMPQIVICPVNYQRRFVFYRRPPCRYPRCVNPSCAHAQKRGLCLCERHFAGMQLQTAWLDEQQYASDPRGGEQV